MKIPLLFALAGTLGGVCWAQTDTAPQQVLVQEKERTYQVPLKNIKASVMASWLDPVHNRLSDYNAAPPRPNFDPAKDSAALPAGVSRIVAVDPQNALLVLGTAEGMASLGNIIKALDKPLRQVEIETHVFRVASDEVEGLGLSFSSARPGPPFSRIKGNITPLLDSAVQRQKAILLTAPRITAFNNATANLAYQDGRAATWNMARPEGAQKQFANQKAFAELAQGTALQVVNNRSWKFTPTLNNDDTITLLTQGEQQLELQGSQGTQKTDGAIVLERQQLPQFIVNLRDGETIAFEEKTLPTSAHPAATQTIVLLTARIVRRAGDGKAADTTDIPVGTTR